MKKQSQSQSEPYKVGAIWWIGWIVTIPIRLVFAVAFGMFLCFDPVIFYGIFGKKGRASVESNQRNWRLK